MTGAADPPAITDSRAILELLDSPVCAVMGTTSPDGQPQASVIWFERRGTAIVLFAVESSIKVRNLRHDPRALLVIVDPERQLAAGTPAFLRLTGIAKIREPEPDLPDRLARRYGIDGGYPWELDPFVTIDIEVGRISGLGPRGTGRLSGWADPA